MLDAGQTPAPSPHHTSTRPSLSAPNPQSFSIPPHPAGHEGPTLAPSSPCRRSCSARKARSRRSSSASRRRSCSFTCSLRKHAGGGGGSPFPTCPAWQPPPPPTHPQTQTIGQSLAVRAKRDANRRTDDRFKILTVRQTRGWYDGPAVSITEIHCHAFRSSEGLKKTWGVAGADPRSCDPSSPHPPGPKRDPFPDRQPHTVPSGTAR